jgi:hypothetical protein
MKAIGVYVANATVVARPRHTPRFYFAAGLLCGVWLLGAPLLILDWAFAR